MIPSSTGSLRIWCNGSIRSTLSSVARCALSTTTESSASEQGFRFPWRHTTEPLASIEHYDDPILPSSRGRWTSRLINNFGFDLFLGASILDILLFQSPARTSLKTDFAWAFQRAVASLCSAAFRISSSDIDSTDEALHIDTTCIERFADTTDGKDKTTLLDNQIFVGNLMDMYQTIDDPTSVDVVFRIQPLDQRLLGTYVIKSLTRDIVNDNPSWRGAYQRSIREADDRIYPAENTFVVDEIDRQIGANGLATLIADVAIDCLQVFQIRDRKTGEIIQGAEDLKPILVSHLVRFEMVTRYQPERKLGFWQISGWDGFVEDNIWY